MKLRFGRYRGWDLALIPHSYLRWLTKQPGLTAETREGVRAALGINVKAAVHRRRPAFDAGRGSGE